MSGRRAHAVPTSLICLWLTYWRPLAAIHLGTVCVCIQVWTLEIRPGSLLHISLPCLSRAAILASSSRSSNASWHNQFPMGRAMHIELRNPRMRRGCLRHPCRGNVPSFDGVARKCMPSTLRCEGMRMLSFPCHQKRQNDLHVLSTINTSGRKLETQYK